jgi:hypothetical protein
VTVVDEYLPFLGENYLDLKASRRRRIDVLYLSDDPPLNIDQEGQPHHGPVPSPGWAMYSVTSRLLASPLAQWDGTRTGLQGLQDDHGVASGHVGQSRSTSTQIRQDVEQPARRRPMRRRGAPVSS